MTYLGLRDPVMVTLLDEALALRLAADDARMHTSGERSGIEPDERYASEDDYDDAVAVAA